MPDDDAVTQVQRMLFLRSIPVTRDVGFAAEQFAAASRDLRLAPGAVIFEAGDPSGTLYFVVEGEVETVGPGTAPWRFGPRDAIGFLDSMQQRAHGRTARARTAVHLLAVPTEDWLDILEDNTRLVQHMIRLSSSGLWATARELPAGAAFAPPTPGNGGVAAPGHLVDRIISLRGSDVLLRVGAQALVSLGRVSQLHHLQVGDTLFEPGRSQERLHVVASGELRVRSAADGLEGRFGPGQLVGGLPALSEGHGLEASAAGEAWVISIGVDDWFDVMEDHFDVARAALRLIASERERIKLATSIPRATRDGAAA